MGDFWRDSARAMAETERWVREREKELARKRTELERRVRSVRTATLQASAGLARQAAAELRAVGEEHAARFGVRIPTARVPRPAPPGRQGVQGALAPAVRRQPQAHRPAYATTTGVRGILQQQQAFERAAADAITFGLRDHLAAGLETVLSGGDLAAWDDRFGASLAGEQAETQFNREHRRIATDAGTPAGMLASLAVPGSTMVRARRLTGPVRWTGPEARAWILGNAAVGTGAQAISDAAVGQQSSPQDLVAAAFGSAVSAIPERVSPGRAGAIEGFATSLAQDVLNGRAPSFERAAKSAVAGRLVGGAAGRLGQGVSSRLASKAKGDLGEFLGSVRSAANGDWRELAPVRIERLPGYGHWKPDGRCGSKCFEDKFGPGAKLTTPQVRGRENGGLDFVLSHFMPEDVARAVGAPLAAAVRPAFWQWQSQLSPDAPDTFDPEDLRWEAYDRSMPMLAGRRWR